MMRKFLGLPFELMQVFGTAVFFAMGGALTLLSAPGWISRVTKLSPDAAGRQFHDVASLIGRHGWLVAAAALIGAFAAPYARGDGKKLIPWMRIACAGVALSIVIVAWGAAGSDHILHDDQHRPADVTQWKSDKKLTPWNGLLVVTGLNLALAAFQIAGGPAKKPAGGGGGGDKK